MMEIYSLKLFLGDSDIRRQNLLINTVLKLEQLNWEKTARPNCKAALFVNENQIVINRLFKDDL